MKKENNTYDSRIAEKANTPFARRLQKLVTNPTALKNHLGCSLQAINQYKQGTAFPKTENLIKIADYYGISVDYLLGRTDIPNLDNDIQSVHNLTGLSVDAICKLNRIFREDKQTVFTDLISLLIEDENAEYFLALLCGSITQYDDSGKSDVIHFDIDGIPATMAKGNLLNTALQTKLIENLPAIARMYQQRFSESPTERLKKEEGE